MISIFTNIGIKELTELENFIKTNKVPIKKIDLNYARITPKGIIMDISLNIPVDWDSLITKLFKKCAIDNITSFLQKLFNNKITSSFEAEPEDNLVEFYYKGGTTICSIISNTATLYPIVREIKPGSLGELKKYFSGNEYDVNILKKI